MTRNERLARSLAHHAVVHREGEHPDGGLDVDENGRVTFPPSEKVRAKRREKYLHMMAKVRAKKKGRAA